MKRFAVLFLLLISIPAHAQNDMAGWWEFTATNTPEQGEIGMTSWLDAPAGKHGFVTIEGSGFAFEDGAPAVFWGTNHGNRTCGPDHEEADRRVAWYSKFGINGIRLHKFTYPNRSGFGDPDDSTRLTAEGWDRLDYYMAAMRKAGIYYGWSHIYNYTVVDGDRDKILYYDEIKNQGGGNTSYLVNFAPDLQDLSIALTVHMLEHVNPYTGLRYADDPGLAFVEMQNEDDIFFAAAVGRIERCPSYKKMICDQFSDWLTAKYGTQENLVAAWGADGMDMFPQYMTGENLDKRNVYPIAHHGYYSQAEIANSKSPRRMYDMARFLYERQIDFYKRYEAAIRATGYRGPLVGSCWQAGEGISHYYNLYADYQVGIIDRHNYFGARPHNLTPEAVDPSAMVDHPGSGLLSSGLQAVQGRPFVLSEWICKMPNEWIVEGPAIIGVYGMGLQGWDGSYHFAASRNGFSDAMEAPNVYNTNNPTQIGLFPAIARMIRRGDITPGDLLPDRKVYIPSLIDGALDFHENVRQQGDVKSLGGDVPIDALALGRVEVEFTDRPERTVLPDFSAMLAEKVVRSNTGELMWDYRGERGYFTVDTASTKAVVGFAGGKSFTLGDVSVRMDSPFAALFITSLDRNRPIASANSVLVTAIARARNTGMRYTAAGDSLIARGGPPLLMEPVKASISVRRAGSATVHVLDNDGLRTGRTIPVANGSFTIDGAAYKTMYYEISYR